MKTATVVPEITRKGQWPLFKYTLRNIFGYHVIMIDDEYGDLFIASDRGAFKHWWGVTGRGTPTLREFLVSTSPSYIADKLSYGLSRWDPDEAYERLHAMCVEKWGKDELNWPGDTAELVEDLQETKSWVELYNRLFDNEDFAVAFEPADLPGESWANVDVKLLVEKVWPEMARHWKMELENEKNETYRKGDSR